MLQPLLGDADRDAGLRLALLKLLDELMESQRTAAAFADSNAQLVLQSLLLPPLVWRAGKVRTGRCKGCFAVLACSAACLWQCSQMPSDIGAVGQGWAADLGGCLCVC